MPPPDRFGSLEDRRPAPFGLFRPRLTRGNASASPFLGALDKLFSSLNQALGNRILPALLRSLSGYVHRDIVHASEPPDAPVVPVAPESVAEPPADAPPVAAVPAADEPPASTSATQPDEVSPGDPNAEGYITEAGVRVFKPAGTTYTQNADGTFTIASQFSHGSSSVTGSAQSLGLTNTVSPTQRRVNYHNTANNAGVSSPMGSVIGDTMADTGDFLEAEPDISDPITRGVDWTSTGASAGTTTGLFGNVVDTASQGTTDLNASDAGYASQMAWLDSLGGNAGSTTKTEAPRIPAASSAILSTPARTPVAPAMSLAKAWPVLKARLRRRAMATARV